MRLPLTAVAALLGLLAAASAKAQPYDPDFRWQTLETPHFQVHYHQGLEALAQRAARIAERAHGALSPLLGYSPRQRTQLVISDDSDDANGSATPVPYDTIRIYAVPAESISELNDSRDWLETLIVHEYVHILHLDNIGGLPDVVNSIFGKIWPPNALTPGWMIEGLAVTHESPEPGAGRNQSAFFDMYARALVTEPPGLPTLAEVSNPYLEWPRGNIPYLLGGRFMAFIEARSGAEAMRGFLKAQGSVIWPWAPSWETERWFGADLPTLWQAFGAELEQRYRAQLEAVRRRSVTATRRLTRRGGTIQHPRWLPDGSGLVYLDRGLDERAGLRRVTVGGEDLGRALAVDLDGAFDLRSAGEAVLTRAEVWHEFRLYDDLYLVDLDHGSERRLSDGERPTDPALEPGGHGVVYVARAGAGEMELRRRSLDRGAAGAPETLFTRPGMQLYEPSVSPDGRSIALSIQHQGRRDLALLVEGRLEWLTDDDAIDLSPAWTPDGRWLLFSSDRGGIYNVYAWSAEARTIRQVTNVESGALEPRVSPDGATLAFVGYTRAGDDLFTTPFDPAGWLDPAEAAPSPPPPSMAEGEPLAPHPYRVSDTVRPAFWLPTLGFNQSGGTYGAFTYGSDVLGLHTWQAQTWVTPYLPFVGYSASYVGGWSWPALDLYSTRYASGSPGDPYRMVAAWVPLAPGVTFSFKRLAWQFALRLGWTPTLISSLGSEPSYAGVPPDYLFKDGLLSEAALSMAFTDARRYALSISPEEGRTLTLRARYAGPELGSDYQLWRTRLAWVEYTRLPFTHHAVLATRVSGSLGHGSLGGSPPFSLGGIPETDLLSLLTLQTFTPSDLLRGYPAGLFQGNGTLSMTAELRFPMLTPDLGRSTWPIFLRRIHGALFVDAGEAFVHGTERGYTGPDFTWERLRFGAGAELRFETVFAYWLLTDIRLGVARGLGKPLAGIGPNEDPYAIWQWYLVAGPSF